jgi:excisionase family DNA binding protein
LAAIWPPNFLAQSREVRHTSAPISSDVEGEMQAASERAVREQRSAMAMNVATAAAEAGVGRDSIYDAIRAGTLDARKLGRRTLITRDALERFIATLPRLELPPAECEQVEGDGLPAPKVRAKPAPAHAGA